MRTYDAIKRGLDVAVTLPILFVTLPFQALVALVIRVRLGKPVLFRQVRPGLHGRPFRLMKFRTMKKPAYEGQPDAERMTRLGILLRSTSLDELPSLSNVILGDMALVGPRPLLMDYVPLYSDEQYRRHEVRPGITGLAQVNGRNDTSWDQRFRNDVDYVDQRSFRLDLSILLQTMQAVLTRKGISHDDEVTMPKFTGARDHSSEDS